MNRKKKGKKQVPTDFIETTFGMVDEERRLLKSVMKHMDMEQCILMASSEIL